MWNQNFYQATRWAILAGLGISGVFITAGLALVILDQLFSGLWLAFNTGVLPVDSGRAVSNQLALRGKARYNSDMEAFRSSKCLSLKMLCFLLLALVAVSGILWMAPTQQARADGGGFPTRTPTRTLIPFFPTVTPTSPDDLLLIFPPTATFTLEANLLGEQAQPPAGQAIPDAGIAASQQPFSLLSCWPFALVVLLVLVVGVMYLSSRRQSTT